MLKSRRITTILILLLAVITVISGCSSQKAASGNNSASTNSSQSDNSTNSGKSGSKTSSKPIKLQVIETGSGMPQGKNLIQTTLDKALNVDLNLTVYTSGDDYTNQLNVRMAAGNFPDLFSLSKDQMKQFAKQNLILDLSRYKDKLKPTLDFIGSDSVKKGMYNGKLYSISKAPQIPYNTYWIRKDWLDKLHISMPKTPDELLKAAKAFTFNDPDGNQKKDTYGLTGGEYGAFSPIFGAYGVGDPGTFYVKNGKIVNSFYDPAMKDALTFIKKMISEGVVDPGLLANTGLQHQQKAIQGKAGIVYIDWPNITKKQFADQIKAVNPNADWVQVPALQGPGGQYDGSWDIGATPARYAIPKALEKDPATLNKVFDLLNYVSTKGSNLVQFGIEGRDYNIKSDKVVPTDKISEVSYSWLYQFTGRPEMTYLQTKFAAQAKYIEFAAKEPRIHTLNGFLDYPDEYNPTDATKYWKQEFAQFIYDKKPLSQYNQFLKTLGTTMGYKKYVDNAVKQLNALGYGQN